MEKNQCYHEVVEKVIEQLKVEFGNELLGIVLSNSVIYEPLNKQCGLEIDVIIRSSWRQSRAFVIAGVNVQLRINPAHQIQKEFQNTDFPETLDNFANGQILYDPQGVIAYLTLQAQYIWQQPKAVLSAKHLLKFRSLLYLQLQEAHELIKEDEMRASFVMCNTLVFILDLHYKLQRRWKVKPKYQLCDLHAYAPDIERLVRCFLVSNNSVQRQYEYLALLVDQVLEPFGGRLEEWKTEPETLPLRAYENVTPVQRSF
ncbi:MAG: hypothetical protein SAL70_43010 [Scytonema sp. PMC 1070.18]|nr:hypothetical protein [Scytonema sp. PMC 1070.18]